MVVKLTRKLKKNRTENSLTWTSTHVSEENKLYLRGIDEHLDIDVFGVRIHITHGSPFSINEYVYENDDEKLQDICEEIKADVIVMGHTHKPYVKQFRDTYIINPGSVGRPKDGDNRASLCVLTISCVDQGGTDQRRKDERNEETNKEGKAKFKTKNKIEIEVVRVTYDVETVAKEIEGSELLDEFADHLRSGLV